MANADISKIKLANGTIVTLKDAQGRADMTTLLGGETLKALGAAAWKAVAAEVNGGGANLPTAEAVKSYVDSAVGKVHNFDVVIDADGSAATGPSVTASADTMYKIYLVPSGEAAAGEYIEYITIKSGDGETATFKWEAIGSTKTNLTGYVPTSTTIAEIKLDHNITVAELQTALGLGAMAYADKASGSGTVQTIDSITMKEVTVAGNAAVTSKAADATLTKADYTPSGNIKIGDAVSSEANKVLTGGSIAVTLKDSNTPSNAVIAATTSYSPAGTVSAKPENGSFSAIKTVAFEADAAGDIQIQGKVGAQTVSLDKTEKTFVTGLTDSTKKAATFTSGQFHPAAFQAGFYTAGTDASLKGGNYTAPTLGEATKGNVASEGIVASVGSGVDAETLIFTTAASAEVVTAQGALTQGSVSFPTLEGGRATVIDTTKFSGGSKDDDTFTAEFMPTVQTDTVNDVTGGSIAEFTFASDKYSLNTTSDTALKDVEFKPTNSATIPSQITYVKPEIDDANTSFTGTSAVLGFDGTKVEKVLVTGVSYDKADATAAFSVAVTPETDVITKTAKTVEIEVSPVAKGK